MPKFIMHTKFTNVFDLNSPLIKYLTVVKQSPLAFLSALDHGIFTSILCGTLPESAEHKYNIKTIQYQHKIQGHYKIYVILI